MFLVKRLSIILLFVLFIGFSFGQSNELDEVIVIGQGNGGPISPIEPTLDSPEIDMSLAPMNNGSAIPAVDNCENGIKLNTKVPFVGDCIKFGDGAGEVNSITAFPILMGGLTKIMMTAILIFSFLMVIYGGTLMVAGGFKDSFYGQGKKHIINVLIALILLGTSGLILKLINPNFFGG